MRTDVEPLLEDVIFRMVDTELLKADGCWAVVQAIPSRWKCCVVKRISAKLVTLQTSQCNVLVAIEMLNFLCVVSASRASRTIAVQAITTQIKDSIDTGVRREAVRAVGSIALKEDVVAVNALTNSLNDSDRRVRWFAVHFLGRISRESNLEVSQALIPSLRDPDAEVRQNAMSNLAQTAKGHQPIIQE